MYIYVKHFVFNTVCKKTPFSSFLYQNVGIAAFRPNLEGIYVLSLAGNSSKTQKYSKSWKIGGGFVKLSQRRHQYDAYYRLRQESQLDNEYLNLILHK